VPVGSRSTEPAAALPSGGAAPKPYTAPPVVTIQYPERDGRDEPFWAVVPPTGAGATGDDVGGSSWSNTGPTWYLGHGEYRMSEFVEGAASDNDIAVRVSGEPSDRRGPEAGVGRDDPAVSE